MVRTIVGSRYLHKKPKHSMQLDLKSFLETCLSPVLKMKAIWQSVLKRLWLRNSGVSFQPCFITRLRYWEKHLVSEDLMLRN